MFWARSSSYHFIFKQLYSSWYIQAELNFLERKAFFHCLSHAHFRFWGHEHLTNISLSKHYAKSNAAPWVEKSSTSRALHACDTGFYCLFENALHEHIIAEWLRGVWIENAAAHHYSPIALDKRVTFWLQRARSLPCACVALFAHAACL